MENANQNQNNPSKIDLQEVWDACKSQATEEERGSDYQYIMELVRSKLSPMKESTALANHWNNARTEAINAGECASSEEVYKKFKKRIEGEDDPMFKKVMDLDEGYQRYKRIYT